MTDKEKLEKALKTLKTLRVECAEINLRYLANQTINEIEQAS